VCASSLNKPGPGVYVPEGVGGRTGLCVCLRGGRSNEEGVLLHSFHSGLCGASVCAPEVVFPPLPPVAHKRKLLVNLPFMSREMQFGSSPRIYPSLISVSELPTRSKTPCPHRPSICTPRRRQLYRTSLTSAYNDSHSTRSTTVILLTAHTHTQIICSFIYYGICCHRCYFVYINNIIDIHISTFR